MATDGYAELEKARKALKHARIKRDRVPGHDAAAKKRAEERVATLEKQRDELFRLAGVD